MNISYAHGASDIALLGETIGANFERTVAAFPDHEALVSRHQDLDQGKASRSAAFTPPRCANQKVCFFRTYGSPILVS